MIKTDQGFSLLEVLVGLFLISIGLLAIAAMQTNSLRGNFFSQSLMQATYIAQDRLESLRTLPFASDQLKANSHTDEATTINGIVYSREYRITDAVPNELKVIDYTVRWNDGINHRIMFSTRRSQ